MGGQGWCDCSPTDIRVVPTDNIYGKYGNKFQNTIRQAPHEVPRGYCLDKFSVRAAIYDLCVM